MPEQEAPRLDASQPTDSPSEATSPSQLSQTNRLELPPGYSLVLSPAQPVAVAPKKTIFFPITRSAPLGKQLLTLLLYSLLLVVLFAGSTPFLLIAIDNSIATYNSVATYNVATTNILVNPDGTANGPVILAMIAFFFSPFH